MLARNRKWLKGTKTLNQQLPLSFVIEKTLESSFNRTAIVDAVNPRELTKNQCSQAQWKLSRCTEWQNTSSTNLESASIPSHCQKTINKESSTPSVEPALQALRAESNTQTWSLEQTGIKLNNPSNSDTNQVETLSMAVSVWHLVGYLLINKNCKQRHSCKQSPLKWLTRT